MSIFYETNYKKIPSDIDLIFFFWDYFKIAARNTCKIVTIYNVNTNKKKQQQQHPNQLMGKNFRSSTECISKYN